MLETVVGILGAASVGIVAWVIQLGTRVSVVETQRDGLTELLETKFGEVNRRLGRMEAVMTSQSAHFADIEERN